MNSVSTIPAPVAAQISGPGSFFGSCQIASGNFEDILNAVSENIMPGFPAICDSGNLAEPAPLPFAFQDFGKSEVLMQLQQVLGEDAGAEAFGRIMNLLEKGTLSVQADTINWDKDTFEKLTVSLLERLDIAIKQITNISGDAQEYENDFNMEKFLNLITDLLKTGMISPQEYEIALKNPEESSLPELLGELKKEAGKLIEKLESAKSIETEQIAVPWQAEQPRQAQAGQPRQIEQPKQAEQPIYAEQPRQAQVEQPKQAQVEQPIYAEQPRQAQVEQPICAEQPRQAQVEQPIYAEQPRQAQVEQPKQAQVEQPIYAEQPKQAQVEQPKQEQVEQPIYAEQPRQAQVEQPKQAQVEQPIYAEQPRVEQTGQQAEQPRQQAEQPKQAEPLLEELRVISMEMEMEEEVEIKSKDKVKFYELLNNLLEKGLISEQDLKNAIKIPAIEIDNENNSFESNSKSKENKAEKIEPAIVKNVLEKLWANLESANKAEKENIFSKFKEIVEAKNTTSERMEVKSAKVEPEIRAVWEAGDLKIETVNPKTGEKLQSIPVANSHRMQERINEFEVVRQVVSQAKFITTPTGEQRLTMQLRPEHLGQMNLRIVLNNGEMQIHARVESTTAQAALESHIGLLREGLEKQGINLERLEVSVEQREKQDAFSLAEREEQQERHGKGRRHRNKEMHLAVSVKNDANSDTGRRLGYNTMEYLA